MIRPSLFLPAYPRSTRLEQAKESKQASKLPGSCGVTAVKVGGGKAGKAGNQRETQHVCGLVWLTVAWLEQFDGSEHAEHESVVQVV